ncbi:MAG TPA: hypothetical protein VGC97_11235 [Pyrinomonadaceae bacterium]|jgi:hypothetical protein
MEVNDVLDFLPLWALCVLTVLIVLISIEGGHRLARYRPVRVLETTEIPVGTIVGAILGLLAFMLAFTFGFASSRFEERKIVLIEETNAIGTAYLRAGLMPEPVATNTRNILREYIDVRLDYALGQNKTNAILSSEKLHEQLWQQAVAAAEKRDTPISALFVDSVNTVIDLHTKRLMVGLRNRVPDVIWVVLYSLIIFSMVAIGYQGGLTSAKRSLVALPLVFAFSAVLMLIIDLDRPGEGLLRVNQQSMIDLKNSVANPGGGQQ